MHISLLSGHMMVYGTQYYYRTLTLRCIMGSASHVTGVLVNILYTLSNP